MERYIDADKLLAKIAELRKELPDTIEHLNDEESGFARGQQYELTAMEAEILCLLQEQDEQPEYGYLSTEYINGKKSRWNAGDVLAYYVCTSNEEGEYLLGKIVNVEFDEDGWVYTFEDESVWDEQSLVEEEAYKKN